MNPISLLLLMTVGLSVTAAWNLNLSPNEERLQNRRAGDNFLVVCKVKEYDGAASDVKIEWFRDGKLIPRFGSTMTIERTYSNQLMINRPKTSDGGKYTCKAEIHGETQEMSADISFVDPPKFVNPQTEQHPEEGTRAEIVCQIEGTDQLEVFWQFNGVTLDETSQRGYEFSENRQTLFIPHFNAKKDDGVYNCNAAQYASFETLSINVTGYARPTITVFDVPSGQRGLEGHTIELKCGAVGKPKPSYKWYFENDEVSIEHSDKHNVEEGLLIIESLNSEDAGTYKCIANNTVGTDERTVKLSVFLKPKLEIQNEFVKKEGEDVEIICNYHGEGQVSAKFVYGTQEFAVKSEVVEKSEEPVSSESEEVAVDEPQAEDSSSPVSHHAHPTPVPENSVESGENLENLEKQLPAISEESEQEEKEESRKWKRFVDDVNSERISIRGEENKLILSIKQLSLEDAGAYKCHVSNEAGTSEKSAHVNIIHPPTLRHYTGSQIRSFDGNTASIYCDVSAVPAPKWKWYKDGDEVEANGASIQIDSHGTSTKLTLQHNEGNDNYGRYTCKADNGVGILEKQIEVVHVVRPAQPVGIDCKKFMYPNYGRCSFEEGLYNEESGRPLKIEFLVAKMDEIESDFNWNDALPVVVDFENDTTIPNLAANTQYMIKARATNEAGSSEYTEEASLETTDPWAPQAPKSVQMECSELCTVSWTAPNDHGSPITNYRITIHELQRKAPAVTPSSVEQKNSEETSSETEQNIAEFKLPNGNESSDETPKSEGNNEENNEEDVENRVETTTVSESETKSESEEDEDSGKSGEVGGEESSTKSDENDKKSFGNAYVIEVGPDETELQLTHIKPHSYYRVAVAAINAIGQGEPLEIEHETDESPSKFDEGFATSSLIIAAAIGIFFLLLVIDFICFLTNRCGMIACCCLNLCGKNTSRKQRDLESGKKGPESNRLLDSNATSWKYPLTTTV